MTFNKLKLAPLKVEQLPQIVALDKSCLGGLWTLKGYQKEIESPNSYLYALTMINEFQETIIGFGCFWAILEEAHITILLIHPDYQGQGLGKLILYYLLKNAMEINLERATLEVKESNQIAINLYQKFGFKVAGCRKGYYQETGENALILWRGDLGKPEFTEKLLIWQAEITQQLITNNWLFQE